MVTAVKKTKAKKATKAATTAKVIEDTVVEAVTDTGDIKTNDKPVDVNMVKKKDMYDHVSVSTGLRKRDVREAVDCLLEYFHKSLEDGKTLQVPPLGKIKPVERGSGENVKIHYKLTLKKSADSEKKVD